MEYRIEDIEEADYGCEERAEGQPLLCCLVLSRADQPEKSGGEFIYRNIGDQLAEELCLEKGQILTEEELDRLAEGRKPDGWDDPDRRNIYRTDIGPVCMSHAEYRAYREKKEEMGYADKRAAGNGRNEN